LAGAGRRKQQRWLRDEKYKIQFGRTATILSKKSVFKLEPITFTVPMMTIEIPPAIRAYSTAVTPDSLRKKRRISLLIDAPFPSHRILTVFNETFNV
jgi:hypothetical protein